MDLPLGDTTAILTVGASDAALRVSESSRLPGRKGGPAEALETIVLAAELTRHAGPRWAGIVLGAVESTLSPSAQAMFLHNIQIGNAIGAYVREQNGFFDDVVKLAQQALAVSLASASLDKVLDAHPWTVRDGLYSASSQDIELSNGQILPSAAMLAPALWQGLPDDAPSLFVCNWPTKDAAWTALKSADSTVGFSATTHHYSRMLPLKPGILETFPGTLKLVQEVKSAVLVCDADMPFSTACIEIDRQIETLLRYRPDHKHASLDEGLLEIEHAHTHQRSSIVVEFDDNDDCRQERTCPEESVSTGAHISSHTSARHLIEGAENEVDDEIAEIDSLPDDDLSEGEELEGNEIGIDSEEDAIGTDAQETQDIEEAEDLAESLELLFAQDHSDDSVSEEQEATELEEELAASLALLFGEAEEEPDFLGTAEGEAEKEEEEETALSLEDEDFAMSLAALFEEETEQELAEEDDSLSENQEEEAELALEEEADLDLPPDGDDPEEKMELSLEEDSLDLPPDGDDPEEKMELSLEEESPDLPPDGDDPEEKMELSLEEELSSGVLELPLEVATEALASEGGKSWVKQVTATSQKEGWKRHLHSKDGATLPATYAARVQQPAEITVSV